MKFFDKSISTKWHEIQLCKLFLATFLTYKLLVRERRIAHLPEGDIRACVNWCGLWLQPHWSVEILKVYDKPPYDVKVKIFPVDEMTLAKGNIFFEGKFSDLLNGFDKIIKELNHLEKSEKIISAAIRAEDLYGKAIPIIDESGEIRIIDKGLVEIGASYENYEEIRKLAEYNDFIIRRILDFLDSRN